MKRSRFMLLSVAVLMVCVPALSSAQTFDVSMQDFFFSPAGLTINVGDTVRWTNQTSTLHTTTSGQGCSHNLSGVSWTSGTLLNGQDFSFTFDQPGVYPYFCEFHCSFGMTGTITVMAAPSAIPSPVGQQIIPYIAPVNPVTSSDPFAAMPVGVGSVAQGGNLLTVGIALNQLAVPMDIYAAFVLSSDPATVINIGPGLAFQSFSVSDIETALATGIPPAGIMPWMPQTTGPVNATLFSNLPVSMIPPGAYTLYLLATPGNLGSFYLWQTQFTTGP